MAAISKAGIRVKRGGVDCNDRPMARAHRGERIKKPEIEITADDITLLLTQGQPARPQLFQGQRRYPGNVRRLGGKTVVR
jgi:hypothetical protein